MHTYFISLFLNLGSSEVFLIVLVIVMFFGTDKLPEVTRALGKGMREMKNAAGEIQREIENSASEIKREINLQEEVDEISKATVNIRKQITEGLNNLENHYKEAGKNDKEKEPTGENDQPTPPPADTPPGSIQRN